MLSRNANLLRAECCGVVEVQSEKVDLIGRHVPIQLEIPCFFFDSIRLLPSHFVRFRQKLWPI